uniref:hypothetical protein n=1 Tax=Roseivirga sp. TaxID=1964215 RepID=UPI0040479D6C
MKLCWGQNGFPFFFRFFYPFIGGRGAIVGKSDYINPSKHILLFVSGREHKHLP